MEQENKISGIFSDFVDKVSFANYLPLLTRATAENDEPTAGYMFQEIEKITFQPPPTAHSLAEYLNRRLEKPSPSVKLKVLKVMLHLVHEGHLSFRDYLRSNDGSIKLAAMYSGPPDPLLGTSQYENVRTTAQGLLDVLFDPELIQQDSEAAPQMEERARLQLGGLGSTGSTGGKYEGFGNSPRDKEETVAEKMIDMLEKLMNPEDETAEKIKSALSSSPGLYKAVPVSEPTASTTQTEKPAPRSRAHVPGRAGGGWESDEETISPANSGSTVSMDSLEKIDPEGSPARDLVAQFCNCLDWPVSPSAINTTCERLSTLNVSDVLEAISYFLQKEMPHVAQLRALLLLEWFVRTDLVSISSVTCLVAPSLNNLANSGDHSVKVKAQKMRLVLEKLQPRRG